MKSPSLILKQVLHLPAAIAGFYIQDAVLVAINNMSMNTLLFRLEDDIKELSLMHQRYVNKLAGALFDYIALASFGEARHAVNHTTYYIHQICYKWDKNNNEEYINVRNESYHHALKFNPHLYLPVLSELFNDYKWKDTAYGGKKWADIVEAGIMYNDIPNKVFIDHAVDLSHNGGSMFNKDILFLKYPPDTYLNMLNAKRYSPSILVHDFLKKYPISLSVKPFLKIAAKLGIIDIALIYGNEYRDIEFPDVIEWGLLPITSSDMLPVIESEDENENEDEDEDEDGIEDETNYKNIITPKIAHNYYIDELSVKKRPSLGISLPGSGVKTYPHAIKIPEQTSFLTQT